MANDDFRFGISAQAQGLDLNQLLISRPESTYFMRLAADSIKLGLGRGDILLIEKGRTPVHHDLVVVGNQDSGELTVEKFSQTKPIEIWGVAIHLIRKLKP